MVSAAKSQQPATTINNIGHSVCMYPAQPIKDKQAVVWCMHTRHWKSQCYNIKLGTPTLSVGRNSILPPDGSLSIGNIFLSSLSIGQQIVYKPFASGGTSRRHFFTQSKQIKWEQLVMKNLVWLDICLAQRRQMNSVVILRLAGRWT